MTELSFRRCKTVVDAVKVGNAKAPVKVVRLRGVRLALDVEKPLSVRGGITGFLPIIGIRLYKAMEEAKLICFLSIVLRRNAGAESHVLANALTCRELE
jgi:hypothetical protein